MRALILLLMALPAHAASPTAKITTQIKSEEGSTGLSSSTTGRSTSQVLSIDASSGSILDGLVLRLGIDRTNAEYNRYLLTARDGTVYQLSQVFSRPEFYLRSGLDFYLKSLSLSLDASHTEGETPFPGYSAKVAATYEAYPIGGKVFFSLSQADHRSPVSYFVDPDIFATRLRPARNKETRSSLGWEQIFSETTKGKIEATVAVRPGSRPPYRGAEISLAKALGDSVALIGKLGTTAESKSSAPLDDRGYLGASWGLAELRLEPSYRWSIAGRMGTILETETKRGRNPKQKVGTDTVGLEARTRGKSWEIGLSTTASFANTGYRSFQVGGDLTWSI